MGMNSKRGLYISGIALSKVASIEGCPYVRAGLYRGVSLCQGWPL